MNSSILSFNKKALLFSLAVSTSKPDKSTFDETIFRLSSFVSLMDSSKLQLLLNTSYIVFSLSSMDIPNPVVALPCGSKSITKTFFLLKESAVAKLITVVVLKMLSWKPKLIT